MNILNAQLHVLLFVGFVKMRVIIWRWTRGRFGHRSGGRSLLRRLNFIVPFHFL